jgi:sulfite oxidase
VTDHASAEKKFEDIPPMYDTPINSIVAVPADGETVPLPRSGMIETKGYAVPQGADGPVIRVEVSGDGGKTWVEAELSGASHGMKWCWVLWKAQLKMTPGSGKEILSRATDARGNTQQEHSQWNLRGMGYSGYGRTENLTIVETSHEGE